MRLLYNESHIYLDCSSESVRPEGNISIAQTHKFAFQAQLFEEFLCPHYCLDCRNAENFRPLLMGCQCWLLLGGSNLMIYPQSIHSSRLGEGTNSWTRWWVQHIHILWGTFVVCYAAWPTLHFQTIFSIFYNSSKLLKNEWIAGGEILYYTGSLEFFLNLFLMQVYHKKRTSNDYSQ